MCVCPRLSVLSICPVSTSADPHQMPDCNEQLTTGLFTFYFNQAVLPVCSLPTDTNPLLSSATSAHTGGMKYLQRC